MSTIPDTPNYYCMLRTTLPRKQVAKMYAQLGWQIRRCNWTDFEIKGPWCELTIEAESPVLMHGAVENLLLHLDELVAPLRSAKMSFTAECYGVTGELLRELDE